MRLEEEVNICYSFQIGDKKLNLWNELNWSRYLTTNLNSFSLYPNISNSNFSNPIFVLITSHYGEILKQIWLVSLIKKWHFSYLHNKYSLPGGNKEQKVKIVFLKINITWKNELLKYRMKLFQWKID